MAIHLIDIFSYTQFDGIEDVIATVNVKFDDVAMGISAVYETGDPEAFVSELDRGRADNDLITSLAVGSVQYNFVSLSSYPFAYIESTEPVENQCDLVATVTATTPETAQGAKDGTMSFSVSGSFSGKLIRLDDGEWEAYLAPSTYAGLPPGPHVFYAKDANGCTSSVSFNIVAFENPIETDFLKGLPVTEISTGNISKWNAAFNPVLLKFEKDITGKTNYRTEIEITSVFGKVTGTWYPNPQGKTRADISGYLRTLVNSRDNFDYSVLNWRDMDRAASFTIRYREVWEEGTSEWFSAPYPLYVTYSAKQLGDLYGGNMGEYVPFANEPNPDKKAKFLTLFKEPTYWPGLPYDNSFILSESVVTEGIQLRTESLDINKNLVTGAVVNEYLLNNDAGYILAGDMRKLIIQQGALPPVSNDGILEQLGINRLMVAGPPGNGVEYFRIQLFTGDSGSPNFITQPLTIKISGPCSDPYVYLKWLNTLGGWEYWRFGKDQLLGVVTADNIAIDRTVMDWENDRTIAQLIKKTAARKLDFGAQVGNDKTEGLMSLHYSTEVQMLMSTNPIKWQTVRLAAGSFQIKRTRANMADLKFSITLPEINIQINGA